MSIRLKNQTPVTVKLPNITFTGKVVGYANDLPVMGIMYIVQAENVISDVYKYSCCVVPEIYLEVL